MVDTSAAVLSNLALGEGGPAEAEGAGSTGLRKTGPWPLTGLRSRASSMELSMCACPALIGRLIKDPTDASLPPSTFICSVCD